MSTSATAAHRAATERRGAATPGRDGRGDGGLRCRVCGLDEVPWPRTAYCSERCRRRAAYLARRQRRHGAPGRLDEAHLPKGTRQ